MPGQGLSHQAVAEDTDAFDIHIHHVAGLEPVLFLAFQGHAAGGAGIDEVAGAELYVFGGIADYLGAGEYHVPGTAVLAQLAVHIAADGLGPVRVIGVGGDYAGAAGAEAGHGLADEPLAAAHLGVSQGEVVAAGIAEDGGLGLLFIHVPALPAHDDDDLRLVVIAALPGRQLHRGAAGHQGIGELGEEDGKVRDLHVYTGGVGAVYATTTNPNIATGDGIAMAYRAKATVKDMEFIQFHPTALFHPGETHPAYLITEAMRGYGGILKLPNGEEFMQKYDKRLSLAPRDIVARAIDHEMKIHGLDHVCLDVTYKDPEETKKHFPNIYKKCLSIGIDITKDYIPVAPCAHYLCGGIKVDENACSSIHRLYAVGECSCTGLHGGNRLASNSLIEAVVYAKAAADHSLAHVDEYGFNEKVPEWNDTGTMTNEEKVLIAQDVKEVGQTMSNYVGIVRSNLRLHRAWTRLDLLYEETEELFKRVKATRDICELRNMINVGYLITRMAIERKESRGLHYTVDYPKHAYDQK